MGMASWVMSPSCGWPSPYPAICSHRTNRGLIRVLRGLPLLKRTPSYPEAPALLCRPEEPPGQGVLEPRPSVGDFGQVFWVSVWGLGPLVLGGAYGYFFRILLKKILFYLRNFLVALCLRGCLQPFLSSCGEQELLSSCSMWASHCGRFSCCRAWALGTQASVLQH